MAAIAALIALVVTLSGGGGLPAPPRPGVVDGAGPGDPFAYSSAREADFVARATAGNAHVLFAKSPGGAIATAARVATWRPAIDRAVAGSGIPASVLEGLVFVESAGRPDAIAGSDPADAAGLTQILAQTGQSLLGMHIDLAASRRLTNRIDRVAAGTASGRLGPLLRRRAKVDDRFDPPRALAAAVRYLKIARARFGRLDLAVASYHMGIGNLQQVLADYDSGRSVPYAQLYFDSTPTRHAAAYRLLAGFGDDSSLYWWRVLGAVQIMRLYRQDRGALRRLAALQAADDAGAAVLHPPGRPRPFADPGAVAAAYQSRRLVPLPANAAALGLAIDPGMGTGAASVGAPRALYRGLTPGALRLLVDMAAAVRRLSGVRAPLWVGSTVADERYQRRTGLSFAPAATGWAFTIDRRYAAGAQAAAFQAVLDRLQSLNLIAWAREPATIEVTVASDAAAWLRRG